MSIRHKVEVAIAKRIKGGLIKVYSLEKQCKLYCPLIAFFMMLTVPVLLLAIFK